MKILILTIFIISFNKYCLAESLFQTSFHNVEFISKNIDDDKIKKINKIKKKSILSILKKTLLENDYNEISTNISNDRINTFIKNIIINEEKIINNKYISKIKINFDKKKIIDFYRSNNMPYVEYYPKKFLLIVYEKDPLYKNLFTKKNNYYKYFNNNFTDFNLFKIPNLDINDRYILKKNDISKRNFEKIKNFANKYHSDEVIIVVSEKNKKMKNYNLLLYSTGETSEKNIQLKNTKFDIFFKILENETLNLWKQMNSIQNETVNKINCKVSYFNLLELKEIKKKLINISSIQKLNIKSLSYKNIDYEINYYGDFKILFNLFKLNKLKISKYENSCIIGLS